MNKGILDMTNLPSVVTSPITGKEGGAALIKQVPSQPIVEHYKREFHYDCSDSFSDVDFVGLYECMETSYRFFYPLGIAGPESLYRALEKFRWNYREVKWEHDAALRHIKNRGRILDVGCGQGWFLKKARNSTNAEVAGIELNTSAASFAREQGISVCEELLGDHASSHRDFYDVVTAFQVLEHIAEPRPFISQCLQVLKPGGLLIYSVPNNDGFLKFTESAYLNGPPHHMGLWTRRSLDSLTPHFPLELSAFEIEPLAELAWYQQVMETRYLPTRWKRSLFHRIGGARIFGEFIRENACTIAGHSIMVVFTKQ